MESGSQSKPRYICLMLNKEGRKVCNTYTNELHHNLKLPVYYHASVVEYSKAETYSPPIRFNNYRLDLIQTAATQQMWGDYHLVYVQHD